MSKVGTEKCYGQEVHIQKIWWLCFLEIGNCFLWHQHSDYEDCGFLGLFQKEKLLGRNIHDSIVLSQWSGKVGVRSELSYKARRRLSMN
jgi:hypothetical protein